jgi:predicted nicotinamide N-methyase
MIVAISLFYQKPLAESLLLLNPDIIARLGREIVEYDHHRYSILEVFQEFPLETIRRTLSHDIWINEEIYKFAFCLS